MGATAVTLKKDATGFTVTGGTDLLYTPDGVQVPGGLHLAASYVTSFAVRPNITLRTKNPVLDSTGVYSKGKRWINVVIPKTLASGKTVFNLVRIETEIHPESTAAETADLINQAAQTLFDSDLSSFIATGSLA